MVRIPTPVEQGQPIGSVQTDAANTPFMNVSPADTSRGAAEMQQLGTSLAALGTQIQQKRDRVALRQVEEEWYDFERSAIYDPSSGLYTVKNGDAVGITDTYANLAKAKRQEIETRFDGRLSGSGKDAVSQLLAAGERRTWQRAATHETSQLESYERAQIAGGLEAEKDRASAFWSNPEELQSSLTKTIGLATDEAEGLDGDAREQHIQQRTTEWAEGIATRMLAEAPTMVEEWVNDQIAAGIMDETFGKSWLEANRDTIVNNQARTLVFGAQAATGGIAAADPVRGSPVGVFLDRLVGRESSNRPGVQRTNQDGRVFVGLGQVGEARLSDMKRAGVVPQDMTLEQFGTAENAGIQRDALAWHIADIDREIDKNGYLDKGWTRDGLRAVAHLGGIGGMHRFVMSGGRYNPEDELQTSLNDYYNEFSGAPGARGSADQRIAQEGNPEVQAVAFKLLDDMRARQHRADERLADQAYTAIITDYETAGRDQVDFDLGAVLNQPGVLEALGSKVESLRDYIDRQERGVDVVTDPTAVQDLERLIQRDPQAFVNTNIIDTFGSQLSNSDMKAYLQEQTSVAEDLRTPNPGAWTRAATTSAVTDILSANQDATDAARGGGVFGGKTDDKVFTNRIVQQAMLSARLFKATNGRDPDDFEFSGIVRDLLTQEVKNFDPAGWSGVNDQRTGENLQSILVAADKLPPERFMTDGEVDITLTYNTRTGPVNHDVTASEFTSGFNTLRRVLRRDPLPSEVLMMLQQYPPSEIAEMIDG